MATLLWEVDDMAASSHGYPSPNKSFKRTTEETDHSMQCHLHDDNCRSEYRDSGLVYAREGVLLAGCKSLSELATAP